MNCRSLEVFPLTFKEVQMMGYDILDWIELLMSYYPIKGDTSELSEEQERDLEEMYELKKVTVRLRKGSIQLLKYLATEEGSNYQALLRRAISNFLQDELPEKTYSREDLEAMARQWYEGEYEFPKISAKPEEEEELDEMLRIKELPPIRLGEEKVEELEERAQEEDVGIQTYVRKILKEHLRGE
ncbi:MAG: hypothetical protein ABEJ24_05255 [Candidatus Magasanikbacteria bacterium]